jgi:hypothetical protein
MNRIALTAALMAATAALEQQIPVPPIPPERPPPGETAPVPDLYATAPATPESTAPRLKIRQFRTQPYGPGVGFVPGSRYESAEDRKPIQTPGLSISVPLE